MNIAILGAGYAGLAAAWHLLSQQHVAVTVFDPAGVGHGASGASTGLLHPYPAKAAKRSEWADEGMREAALLIEAAEKALKKPVALRTGILRLSMSGEQTAAFRTAGADAEYWSEEQVVAAVPGAKAAAGLWIPGGMTVFSTLYLEGLWRACASRGAVLATRAVNSLAELEAFDRIVIAAGPSTLQFEACKHLPLKSRKGQALICRKPTSWQAPPFSLVGYGHLSLSPDPSICYLGSTYEEDFSESAAIALQSRIGGFLPEALNFEVLGVLSGVRVASKQGYLPLIAQVGEKAWVFSGLGSRGLLYHGLYGNKLAHTLCG